MISGRKGKVMLGATLISGIADWDYSGDTLEIIETPVTFDATQIDKYESVFKGGEITVNGQAIIGDAGLTALEAAFNAKTRIADLQLYLDNTPSTGQYLTPDTATTPASYVLITTRPNAVKNDSGGTVSFSFKATVSGKMKRVAAA